jgi:phosphoribosylformylglycinamidine cyclo-ligase
LSNRWQRDTTLKMSSQNYSKAGVDIDKADKLVTWLGGDKGFASSYALSRVATNLSGYELVASTDGVGTKVLLAIEHNQLSGLGHDLVGMCVNDLYCVGAKPLFFLDYYATGELKDLDFKAVLGSIQSALKICHCELLGGETAEMPGLYAKGHFDLAGFVVGIVETEKKLGPHRVKEDDVLIALQSSGFHSNGYSLIRHWIKNDKIAFQSELLNPTTIYSKIEPMFEHIHAAAHITGGGIPGNLIRVLPEGLTAHIDWSNIRCPEWMSAFLPQEEYEDLKSVFNLGVGMILVCPPEKVNLVLEKLHCYGAYKLGNLKSGKREVV